MNIAVKFLCSLAFLLLALGLKAQPQKLANKYYADGEFEKAAPLFEELYQKERATDYYFQRYTECLIELKRFDEAKSVIQSEIKLRPTEIQLYITLGNLFERTAQPARAKEEYEKAITKLDNNIQTIDKVARTFTSFSLFDYSIKAYERGSELIKDPKAFAYNLAELYRRSGDRHKMINAYLLSLDQFANNKELMLQTFERNLEDDDMAEFQTQLYAKMQVYPDDIAYPELLEWSFISQKDYKKALRQARAMDRKYEENGARLMNIGSIASNDEDYDTAIEAFAYITETKSINSSYFLAAKKSLLNAKRKKITQSFSYTKADLLSLDTSYWQFLDIYGKNTQTAPLMIEYAEFNALFINNLQKARDLLTEVTNFGGLQPTDVANAKLKLGDYYLMDGERWESSLLYSQVDKDFKEGVLGEQARYRNAKLSYYLGDFEWAQEQFDILKSATTRLISNDAIDLSVFIMDNLNLDTIAIPMELYAQSELLTFQNKFTEAFEKLDSISILYPEHTLQDDILYSKAQIYKKLKQPDKAIEMYNLIIEKFPEEIRCDNAIYELAKMYDLQLNQLEKAKALYEKLFMQYTNSTFASDARKRYRILRGDEI